MARGLAAALWDWGSESVFQGWREYRQGQRPDYGKLPNTAQTIAAGHHAAFDHHLQRVDGPNPAARTVRQRHVGAGTERLWSEFYSYAAGHRGGRLRAPSLHAAQTPRQNGHK